MDKAIAKQLGAFGVLTQNSIIRPVSSGVLTALVFLAIAFGGVAAFVTKPVVLAGLLLATGLVAILSFRPHWGACLWLLCCPLIVGIARGEGVLVLRPNEFLLLLIAISLGLHLLWDFSHGRSVMPVLQRTDISVMLLMLFGSVFPLLISFGRGTALSQDDLLYAMVFAKYALLYAVFRFSIRSQEQVALSLRVALVSGTIVAIVAALQVLDLFGVPQLLDTYFDAPFEGPSGPITMRGTSTIASSFGLADMMAMCLAIVVAMVYNTRTSNRATLAATGLLFLGGCIAAGSFSGFIGCGVVVLAVGLLTGQLTGLLAMFLPAAMLGVTIFWTAISERLAGFSSYQSLPKSWVGRLDNLERFFWPELFSGWNWLLGVRPAARLAAPETWRDWIYIESGHTWLLWSGGLPLLLAFLALPWAVSADLFGPASKGEPICRVAPIAAIAATAMIFVLMTFDPHLTVRGSADLYFPLLALAMVSVTTTKSRPA